MIACILLKVDIELTILHQLEPLNRQANKNRAVEEVEALMVYLCRDFSNGRVPQSTFCAKGRFIQSVILKEVFKACFGGFFVFGI